MEISGCSFFFVANTHHLLGKTYVQKKLLVLFVVIVGAEFIFQLHRYDGPSLVELHKKEQRQVQSY